MKPFIFVVPPYPPGIMVSLGQTLDELTQSIKRLKTIDSRSKLALIEAFEENDMNNANTVMYEAAHLIIIQLPFARIRTPRHRGILAHEIFHAAELIAKQIGLKHCDQSSEAFAYLIDYITEEIYKRL